MGCPLKFNAKAMKIGFVFLTLQMQLLSALALAENTELKTSACFLKEGDYIHAVDSAERAIRLDPKNAELYAYRAFLYIQTNEYERALLAVNKAIALNNKLADAYLVRALIYSHMKKSAAFDDLAKAEALAPKYTDVYYCRALAYFSLEKENEALKELDKMLKLDVSKSNRCKVWLVRGGIYRFFKEYDKATFALSSAIDSCSTETRAYELRSQVYLEQGQYQKSIEDANKTLSLKPNCAQAFVCRGVSLLRLGDFENGIRDIDHSFSLDKTNVQAWFERAVFCQQNKEYKEAVKYFDQAIRLSPSYTLAYIDRAGCLMAEKRYSEAINDCTKAISLDPKARYAYLRRAECYVFTNNLEKGLSDCNTLIGTLNPGVDLALQADAYLTRADIYRSLKNFAAAVADYEHLEKALLMQPSNHLCAVQGEQYFSMGNFQRAIDEYSRAIRMDSRVPSYYDSRAMAYEKLGQTDLANADRNIARQIRSEQK